MPAAPDEPTPIEELLGALATQIERVRVLYEQYFIGLEKLPPIVARKELERTIAELGNRTIMNTALRFRHQSLLRSWRTHAERLDKVVRDIENGTYRPQLQRRQRREAERGGDDIHDTVPTVMAVPRAGSDEPVPGMTESEMRRLHQDYLEARRAVGETREVPYEALVASLQKQVPSLLERSRAERVVFEVVVRDGRVIVRAKKRRVE